MVTRGTSLLPQWRPVLWRGPAVLFNGVTPHTRDPMGYKRGAVVRLVHGLASVKRLDSYGSRGAHQHLRRELYSQPEASSLNERRKDGRQWEART
jgi:hypothetical protein